MSIWNVLGIGSGSDKKTIKIAYARLLKKARPDEDPKGFKQLHDAYTRALASLKKKRIIDDYDGENEDVGEDDDLQGDTVNVVGVVDFGSEDNVEDNSESPDDIVDVLVNSLVDDVEEDINPSEENTDNHYQQKQEQDWQSLITQINACMNTPSKCLYFKDWEFIESFESMSDLVFKEKVSQELLARILHVNEALTEKELVISKDILNYLSSLFHWQERWNEYNKRYSEEKLNGIFSHLMPKRSHDETERMIDLYLSDNAAKDLHFSSGSFYLNTSLVDVDEFTLRQRVRYSLQRAMAYGFQDEVGHIYAFVGLMMIYGPHFYLYQGLIDIECNVGDSLSTRIKSYKHLASQIKEWDAIVDDDWFSEPKRAEEGRYHYINKTDEMAQRQLEKEREIAEQHRQDEEIKKQSNRVEQQRKQALDKKRQQRKEAERERQATFRREEEREQEIEERQRQEYERRKQEDEEKDRLELQANSASEPESINDAQEHVFQQFILRFERQIQKPEQCYLPKDWQWVNDFSSTEDEAFLAFCRRELFILFCRGNKGADSAEDLRLKPAVLNYILNAFSENKLLNWHEYEQMVEQCLAEKTELIDVITPYLTMPLSEEAYNVIVETAVQAMVGYLMAFTMDFPKSQALTESFNLDKARHGFDKAILYGFGDTVEQYKFVTLMVFVGPHFYLYPEFSLLLENIELSNEQKLTALTALAKEYSVSSAIKDDDWFQIPELLE